MHTPVETEQSNELTTEYNLDELLLSAASKEDGENAEALSELTNIMCKKLDSSSLLYPKYVNLVNKFCELIGFTNAEYDDKTHTYVNPNWNEDALLALNAAASNKIPSALYSLAIHTYHRRPEVAGVVDHLYEVLVSNATPSFKQLALEALDREHLNNLNRGYGYYTLGVFYEEYLKNTTEAQKYYLKAANLGSLSGCLKVAENCISDNPTEASEWFRKSQNHSSKVLAEFKALVTANPDNTKILKNYADYVKEISPFNADNLVPLVFAFTKNLSAGLFLADFCNHPFEKAVYYRAVTKHPERSIARQAFAALKKLADTHKNKYPNILALVGVCRLHGDGCFFIENDGVGLLKQAEKLADDSKLPGDVAYYTLGEIAEKASKQEEAIDLYLKALQGITPAKEKALERLKTILSQDNTLQKISDGLKNAVLEGTVPPTTVEEVKNLKEAAAKKDNLKATYGLALYYADKDSADFNLTQAGVLFAKVRQETQDERLASLVHASLTRLAQQHDNPQIYHALAMSYELSKHDDESFTYLDKAARKGHARSALIVADILLAKKEKDQAIENLGIASRDEKCRKEAIQALEPLIEESVFACVYYLQAKIALNDKVQLPKVIKILELASEKDIVMAQLELAQCYLNGVGVEKDLRKGVRLLARILSKDIIDKRTREATIGLLCKIAESPECPIAVNTFLGRYYLYEGAIPNSLEIALKYYSKLLDVKQDPKAKSLLTIIHQINAIKEIQAIFIAAYTKLGAQTVGETAIASFEALLKVFEDNPAKFNQINNQLGSTYTIEALIVMAKRYTEFNDEYTPKLRDIFQLYKSEFERKDWKSKGFLGVPGQVPEAVTQVGGLLDTAIFSGSHGSHSFVVWLPLAEKIEEAKTVKAESIHHFLLRLGSDLSARLKFEGELGRYVELDQSPQSKDPGKSTFFSSSSSSSSSSYGGLVTSASAGNSHQVPPTETNGSKEEPSAFRRLLGSWVG